MLLLIESSPNAFCVLLQTNQRKGFMNFKLYFKLSSLSLTSQNILDFEVNLVYLYSIKL